MYPRLFQIGHFAIPTYGALIALSLVAALAVLMHFARSLNLNPNKLWNLAVIGILTTLISARLLLVVVAFHAFREHPFWVLGLSGTHTTWVLDASVFLGIAAALLYALADGLPILRACDCIVPCAALAFAIAQAGAFLAGPDYGLPTAQKFSVTYASPFARFWYGTPLAIRLYPVQLFEAIASLAIFAALVWWLPRRTQDGELFGSWLFMSGIAGFFLGFYRASNRAGIVSQFIFISMVIVSAAFLWRRKSGAYTVKDDSTRH